MENHKMLPRILVVDDQPSNLQVVGETLKNSGKYRVNFAKSGEDAFKQVESLSTDLILMDVMMPGLNGYEVCRKLKQDPRYRAIPVIFLTAMQDSDSMVDGFEAGGVDYVTKPFQPAVLLARVEAQLRLYLYHQQEEKMRRYERDSAYHNGLVEISSEVLHNFGNLLASIKYRGELVIGLDREMAQLEEVFQRSIELLKQGEQGKVVEILQISKTLISEEFSEQRRSDGEQLLDSIRLMESLLRSQRSNLKKGMRSSQFTVHSFLADLEPLVDNLRPLCSFHYHTEVEGELPELNFPRGPLSSVILMILKNSIEAIMEMQKSTPEKVGDIILRVLTKEQGEASRYCLLEVVDNGVGIDPEQLNQVIRSQFTTKVEHLGMGLHNAANLISAMQGTFQVLSSGQGQGCTVQILLPLNMG